MAADKVDKTTRSRIMSRIKSKNTSPELIFRKRLFAKGLRYRLHVDTLPGKPDLVFPHYRAVIFINGCYWHGHDCPQFRMPSSNVEYWSKKINQNRIKDENNLKALSALGWRVLVVWECWITGKNANIENTLDKAISWLLSAGCDL